MDSIRIAVLMTCYNRKKITLACLDRLTKQKFKHNIILQVYMVDDGSTDGTGCAIKSKFPEIMLLQGNGNLFWCGGMRLAFSTALKNEFDYYLWLNDDSMLFPDAVQTMLDTSLFLKHKMDRDVLVAGSLKDEKNGTLTYGGKNFYPGHRKAFFSVHPTNEPKRCDVINGNCALITANIAKTVGNLNADFIHAAADYDYSIRARSYGFSSWITPGFVGTGSINLIKGFKTGNSLSIKNRLDTLSSPAGLMRIKDSMIFIRHYGGSLWPLYWCYDFLRLSSLRIWIWFRD